MKRALEIAAGGNHNVLMQGLPGTGKTLLARAMPSILPRLTLSEALEVTRIYSVADMLRTGDPLMQQRPFRAPHHTISQAGLVGGGTIPRPGEITLSHRDCCFWMKQSSSVKRRSKCCASPSRTKSSPSAGRAAP